jgi:hypothetical protein
LNKLRKKERNRVSPTSLNPKQHNSLVEKKHPYSERDNLKRKEKKSPIVSIWQARNTSLKKEKKTH